MSVLHINTFDKGGAANACIGLHKAMLQKGMHSTLLTLDKRQDHIPQHIAYTDLVEQPNLVKKIYTKVVSRMKQHEYRQKEEFLRIVNQEADYFSWIDTPYDVTQLSVYQQADIVNLHWIGDFLDWPSFFTAANTKKIVWTLHDLHPFTGGYHYAGLYDGYLHDDKHYPPARTTAFPDLAQRTLQRKKELLRTFPGSLHIVSPSRWLGTLSQQSLLFRQYPHHTLPYSVDIDVFKPFNKQASREIIGLPTDKLILFFVSQDITKKRKGFDMLMDSLRLLSDIQHLTVCSAGSMHETLPDNIQHIPLGSIYDPRLMAVAYSAADVFVIPSLEDNLPNTVLESLACATPVIGFSTGGIKDMVRDAFNGYLTDQIHAQGLADLIKKFMTFHHQLRPDAIREDVLHRYSPDTQAAAYQKLYANLLEEPC